MMAAMPYHLRWPQGDSTGGFAIGRYLAYYGMEA